MHFILEQLKYVRSEAWVYLGGKILLNIGCQKASDWRHLKSSYSSPERQQQPKHPDSCCVQQWQLRKNNNLNNLEAPAEQHFTFKLNLWCYCCYRRHRQQRLSIALSQGDDQALIWDVIRWSQHEEGALAAKPRRNISEKSSSTVPPLDVALNSRKHTVTSVCHQFKGTDETSVHRPLCAGTCCRCPQWCSPAALDRTSMLQQHGADTFAWILMSSC